MTTPADALVETLQISKCPDPERAFGAVASSSVPGDAPDVLGSAPGVFLWRVMGGLCLLWLVAQEWNILGAWPPSPATGAGWVGVLTIAAFLTLPSRVRQAEGWRRAISSLSALLILGAFAAATGAPAGASGDTSPLLSLAADLLESGLLPALAVLALGFALPPLLAGSPSHREGRNLALAWLLRGLDVLAVVTGLLGLCYVPQSVPGALPSHLLAAAATVAVVALAVCAFRYRGGLVLESPEQGVEFLIPERLVRGGLAAALLALLGAESLLAFRASGPLAALALPFVFWVVARTARPLLLGTGGAAEGQPPGGTLRGRAGLCAGALAALSGLLWCRAAGPPPDPFTPPCLLLALAAVGAAAFGSGRAAETTVEAPPDVAVRVRLRGEARPLPARAALPLLGPREARLLVFISRLVTALRRVGMGLDRALAAAATGVRSVSRRLLAGPLPASLGKATLALAVCWLALKDWLTSDAQDYPALASLAVTLSVLGAASAAYFVRRCGPWRDLLVAGGAAFCLLALALLHAPPPVLAAMPAAGLLTLALALPRLLALRPGAAGAAKASGGGPEAGAEPARAGILRGLRSLLQTRIGAKPVLGAAGRSLNVPDGLKAAWLAAGSPAGAGAGRTTRLLEGVRGLLRSEVAPGRPSWGRKVRGSRAARPPLSGLLVTLAYGGASLLGAGALLLGPADDSTMRAGPLPSLLVVSGVAILLVSCARSSRPAARAAPFAVWGVCAVLYAFVAVPGPGASPADARAMLIGTGLSDHLAWDVPTFLFEQGWVGWALVGALLLWALDRNAQFLAARAGGAGAADPAAGRGAGRRGPDVGLSAGATAAAVALVLNGLLCLPALALCVASLVIAARSPGGVAAVEAANTVNAENSVDPASAAPAGAPSGAGRVTEDLPGLRPAPRWPALAGVAALTAAVVTAGGLCLAAWSLSDPAGLPGAAPFVPLASVPRAVRDAVPPALPAAATWRDGDALLRRSFGSRVAVPPSMSAAVAFHITGADGSASPPRVAAAALLAPLIGRWLPSERVEELYLNDRDYGLPGPGQTEETKEGSRGGAGLAAAAEYYFSRPPAGLSPADARFLVGEQPASGAPPLRLAQAGPAPAFVPLGAPQFHLEMITPPVLYQYAHHDGSVNVRGACVTSVITGDGVRSFVREGGQTRMLRGLGATDAGTFAVKINNSGRAAGWSAAPDGSDHAVLWEADGRCRDLGTLPGYADSRARCVNDRGQVVGYAYNSTSSSPLEDASRPVIWEDGRVHDLGTPPSCTGGRAYAVNDAGQAAGWVMTVGGTHAAVWEGGSVHDLGAFPGGRVSAATAINDAGQVVGSAQHRDGRVTAFLWQDGIMHDLGALPGDTYSSARDINDLGQVVGMSRADLRLNYPGGGGFVWDGAHGMRDISTLVAAAAPLRRGLSRNCQALSINDRGQVLGLWLSPSTKLTFLMTPAAEDGRGLAFRPASGRSYRLVSVNSGKVAGVGGASRAEGAGVVQWRSNGSTDQEWVARDLGGGSWGFVNRGSGWCLAVAAGTPSAPVVQGAPFAGGGGTPGGAGGGRYQQWVLRPQLDGSFELVNRGSGLSLDVSNQSASDGAAVDQWHSTGNANQHWLLQPVK